jgi:drug/metabolite transporter (DMT)-like permease
MSILLALVSALTYGVADYSGGRASRVLPSAVITLVGQTVSLTLVVITVAIIGTPAPDSGTWAWGLAGGAAGAIGLASLYYAFANGAMTVVAPLTAVVGASLPVVVGVVDGERPEPIAYAGIVAALVAVALVSGAIGSRDRPTPPRVVGFAVLAGVSFGALFVALDRTDPDSGLWPLVAARIASVPVLIVLCIVLRARPGRHRGPLLLAVFAGVLDMAANLAYLEAVRGGLLSVVAVVSSLYPASTVMLAFGLDHERVNRWQAVGMGLAVVALVLVTLGRA